MSWLRPQMFAVLALAWVVLPDPLIAAELAFKVLAAGKVNGQVAAGLSEARDGKTLGQIWSSMGLRGAVPKINFGRKMAVAWVGGGTACDRYVLARVQESASDVVLEIEHLRQPPGHMCIMIFTPSHIVASVPLTSKPIRFTVDEGPASTK